MRPLQDARSLAESLSRYAEILSARSGIPIAFEDLRRPQGHLFPERRGDSDSEPTHRARALRKLDVHSGAELARYAVRVGLVDP